MATRQDASKPQEQTKQPEGKPSDSQTKPEEQKRSNDSSMTPYRGGAMSQTGGWEPFARLRDEFDRFFDQMSRGMLGMPTSRGDTGWGGWGIDMKEDDDKFTVCAAAPGFESSDFDVHVHGERLIMRAKHKNKEEEGGYRGWSRNEFYEAIQLPSHVDADKVKATYRNGVLTVTVPKSEGGKPRRVTVEG